MQTLNLAQVMEQIRHLPALPAIVTELMALFESDDVDVERVSALINRDQALTAKVLRVANSSFFGLRGEVATTRAALSILGTRNVRTLTMTAALTSSFPVFKEGWFETEAFWRHSLAAASCAHALAGRTKLNADLAFTTALLHDIGRLVLVTGFPDDYRRVVEARDNADCLMITAEQDQLGFDHAVVGAALAERWKFADAIDKAVADHHHPAAGDASLATVVHVADAMVQALDLGAQAGALVQPLDEAAWDALGLNGTDVGGLLKDIDKQSRAAGAFLS